MWALAVKATSFLWEEMGREWTACVNRNFWKQKHKKTQLILNSRGAQHTAKSDSMWEWVGVGFIDKTVQRVKPGGNQLLQRLILQHKTAMSIDSQISPPHPDSNAASAPKLFEIFPVGILLAEQDMELIFAKKGSTYFNIHPTLQAKWQPPYINALPSS